MHKLSGPDANFLYIETEAAPMHVASLTVCGPPPSGTDPYQNFKAQIAEALPQIPAFKRVLKKHPLKPNQLVWGETDTIDLNYHIRTLDLPKPGGPEQLRDAIEELHSELMDRKHPLWCFYIIQGIESDKYGLEPGGFGLYAKFHHALIDGASGMAITHIIADQQSVTRDPLSNAKIAVDAKKPGLFETLHRAHMDMLQQPLEVLSYLNKVPAALSKVGSLAMAEDSIADKDILPAPKSRFNVRVKNARSFGTNSIPLKEALTLAKATGTKLNDVALSLCGGALRRYLRLTKELPAKPLIAAVPVSLREPGDDRIRNMISAIRCEIGSDIEQPLERLQRVSESARRSKALFDAAKDLIPDDYDLSDGAALISTFAEAIGQSRLTDYAPGAVNLMISNVPGPREPIFYAGSQVTAVYPVSFVMHQQALNITLQSYLEQLDFGLVGCKKAVPNIQFIADAIVEEFELLKQAVAKQAEQAGSEA